VSAKPEPAFERALLQRLETCIRLKYLG
jgi:hypothetical protein